MRSSSPCTWSDESSTSDLRMEAKRSKKKCGWARLRLGPGTATLKGDKKDLGDVLEPTVVVTSCLPPLDANELRTPTDIQLHEEVFIRYPSSVFNSPELLTAARRACSTSLGQTAETVGSAQHHSPTPPLGTSLPSNSVSGPSHQGPIQHEQDHDFCPFAAIRRSEWALRTVTKVRRTSPFDWPALLSSFSVKNAFMFYPPPPTYGFFRDEEGTVQVRSQTGKRAPRLDHERTEYLRRKRSLSNREPDDVAGSALHGIAFANQRDRDGDGSSGEDGSEPSFKLIFIPWENNVQSYYIRSGSVVFGRRVHMGHPLSPFTWPCPIPCSVIRPRQRMSSHVAIFFHCNGEDIGRPSCLRLLTLANALHMTILVPEYPGYGLFEGQPSEASINGSMERVIEFLFSSDPSFTPSRLILIGHSIGTGVAIHVAQFINKIFLKLRDSLGTNHRIPYACPMSHCQQNPAGYASVLRCPPNSSAARFSAGPVTSPTAQRPVPTLEDVNAQPARTLPNAPFPSNTVSTGSGGNGQRASDEQDAADTGPGERRAPTMLPTSCSKFADVRRRSEPKATPPFLCPHYALGGIVLLAPFASLRCVEKWTTLKSYGFNVHELERRRLSVPEGVLVPAPEEWAEDARELRDAEADPPSMEFLRQPSLLFGVARYISFDRFRTIDSVRELQDEVGFFTHTPLLLVHGAQDALIPPINSVAIATALRQATDGRAAKVYLGLLKDEGHNDLHCSHIIRRFYKDVILLPHLRSQRELRDELEELLRNSLAKSNTINNADKPAVPNPTDSASRSNETSPSSTCSSVYSAAAGADHKERKSTEACSSQASSQRAPTLRFPTADPYRTTEPFDEEQAELPTSEPPMEQPCSDENAAAAEPEVVDARQPAEPYLYFIEPAKKDSPRLENSNFLGPVRIRIMYPPQRCNLITGVSPEGSDAHQNASCGAKIFVTEPADSWQAYSRHHHLNPHQHRSSCDPAVEEQQPPCSPKRQTTNGSGVLSCRMQPCSVREQFEGSLRDTLQHTQPPTASFAPAAAMLHIALIRNLDHYDVGSIAVTSLTKYSADAAVALEQWRRCRRNHFIFRCLVSLYCFLSGLFFISLAICHGVMTRPSMLRPYLPHGVSAKRYHRNARVIIWGVLNGVGYLLLGVACFFHARLGLGNLSRYMDTPTSAVTVYTTCRVTAYILCAAAGIFMAMISALTPPYRGGVDWDCWSDLPYSRRVWISYLPRWTMVTSASINMFFLIMFFVKNH
ncbi:hypothetical protein ABL78_3609 [Leptomonas seymouri]|uniref:AB hydrolase-1 domain-containing protein n=1 Tax=Leptomonas seymouri TaxID=5684 RepID=A0A0N0P681_LEPSE|nr:hypothetical protein ABL78_3609 [Leptomonas seymouri]|eukprot:KPI87326.1 hypothetical protein ABL78_3609 [Leptomonas seymouri]